MRFGWGFRNSVCVLQRLIEGFLIWFSVDELVEGLRSQLTYAEALINISLESLTLRGRSAVDISDDVIDVIQPSPACNSPLLAGLAPICPCKAPP